MKFEIKITKNINKKSLFFLFLNFINIYQIFKFQKTKDMHNLDYVGQGKEKKISLKEKDSGQPN